MHQKKTIHNLKWHTKHPIFWNCHGEEEASDFNNPVIKPSRPLLEPIWAFEWMNEWMTESSWMNRSCGSVPPDVSPMQRGAAVCVFVLFFFPQKVVSRQLGAFTAAYVEGGGSIKTNRTSVSSPCECGSQTKVSVAGRVRFFRNAQHARTHVFAWFHL